MNERGEPVYGPRDEVDLGKIRELGLPFWLAGSFASPDRLAWARTQGAAGVQVGTAFAFCRESGIQEDIKRDVLQLSKEGLIDIFTDLKVSPTGFPFKVVQLPGSVAQKEVYESRRRICDMGYLRTAYKRADGSLGYRCPAEPVELYVQKGGKREDTVGRKCLCNGLQSTIGLAQWQEGDYHEPSLVTSGEDVKEIGRFLKPGADSYSARDVIDFILQPAPIPC
jgi:NAD(P)H-dependent flavin oxidoreductase YrpB (nitropropane dioxygenase family)